MKTKIDTAKMTKNDLTEQKVVSTSGQTAIPREQLIAEAAYFRAEQRGFEPGYDMNDWLDAETELESQSGRSDKTPSGS